MKNLLFLMLLIVVVNAIAQEPGCDPEALKKIKGVWLTPRPDGTVNKPVTADIAAAKKILDAIGQRFQEQYTPIGVDARHNYFFDNDMGYYPRYGNPYSYTMLNFNFFCLHGKKTTSGEGDGTHVYFNNESTVDIPVYNEYGEVSTVFANVGWFQALSSFHCPDGKLPDVSKGYHVYGDENGYNLWFVHNGKLPFRYVTRKEFLEKQVAIIEAQLKEQEKKLSSPEMKAAMEANPAYKEQMMEGIKTNMAMHRKPLESYQNDLKKDAAWLNEMAIVGLSVVNDVYRYVFTTLDDPENLQMRIPIMPNPDYYDRKLPKWAPQHITIHLNGNIKKEYVRNQRKLIDDNIEFFKSIVANRGLPK